MPDMIPAVMEVSNESPIKGESSGVSIRGKALEYLLIALNLVLNPKEMFPPSNFPSLSIKSILRIVPKSTIVLAFP